MMVDNLKRKYSKMITNEKRKMEAGKGVKKEMSERKGT